MSALKFLKKSRGFTIIELLIVIAVIAILAVISIVGYSGITQRTENSKTTMAVQAIMGVMTKYKAETGRYVTGADAGNLYPCVGAYDGNTCSSYTGGTSGGLSSTSTTDQMNAIIKQYNNDSIPQPSTQTPTVDGRPVRGIFLSLTPSLGDTYVVFWMLSGRGDCGISGAVKGFEDDGGRICLMTVI